jgi:hypothetical protein
MQAPCAVHSAIHLRVKLSPDRYPLNNSLTVKLTRYRLGHLYLIHRVFTQ